MKRVGKKLGVTNFIKRRPKIIKILAVVFLLSGIFFAIPHIYEFGRRHQRWGHSDAAKFIMNQKIARFIDPDMLYYTKDSPTKQSLLLGGDFKGYNDYTISFVSKSGQPEKLVEKIMEEIKKDGWRPSEFGDEYEKTTEWERALIRVFIKEIDDSTPENIRKLGGEINISIKSSGNMKSKYFPSKE